ncbi:hypothetical protein LTR70_007035 [Exophiala xenobiotica]|uniref:PhoD-like phosphatase domain-containing protein n=1 Tax=Lithohypha guttulata TaxID=1690604 RepID=A0ABR0K5S0_9EURO|nr:hypothetical protein LTR24_006647 [Lithohypha guttulata]KAK5314673.1 hypothetical protein LTR70_007035 [Exophiala xenobiotica]
MNPIDSYRDPALDGLIGQRPPANKRNSRHSRQASMVPRDVYYPPPNGPPAPEGSRGAPIAYPGTDLSGQGLQRSFSQRARGRPFADEAFSDEGRAEGGRAQPAPEQYAARQAPVQEQRARGPPFHEGDYAEGDRADRGRAQPAPEQYSNRQAPVQEQRVRRRPLNEDAFADEDIADKGGAQRTRGGPLTEESFGDDGRAEKSRAQPEQYAARQAPIPQQRTKGRLPAEESFADEDLVERSRAQPAPERYMNRQAPVQEQQAPLQDLREGSSRRQQMIQDNLRSAANAVHSPRDRSERGAYPSPTAYDDTENEVPGLARAPTTKDVTNQNEQRDWAPDRSPLQKLEVTLNDISKEEKRARMQEAEMLHREKTRSSNPSQPTSAGTHQEQPSLRSQPPTIEDVVIESRKPDVRQLSNERPGFEYQTAAVPLQSVTFSKRGQRATSQPGPNQNQAVSSSYQQPFPEPSKNVAQRRSISASHPSNRAPAYDAKAPSGSQRASQKPTYNPDRIATSQERNASHRAALQRLEGDTPAAKTRGDRRNFSEGYGEVNGPPQHSVTTTRDSPSYGTQDPARSRASQSAQQHARTSTPQGQPIPAGLGVQDSPGLRSVDSPAPPDRPNPVQKQKRQSTVSFKEPFERRRPTDEWKSAETARLSSEDFLLEANEDPTRNKAWWEQDTKSRRPSSSAQGAVGSANAAVDDRTAEFRPRLMLKCGPLLRYTGMKRTVGSGAKEYWRGTVMMVTQDSQSSYEKPPVLRLFSQPKSLYTQPAPTTGEGNFHEEWEPLTGSIKMSRIGRALYVRPSHDLPATRDLSRIETDDGLFKSSPPITSADGQSVSVAPVTSYLSGRNGEFYGRYKEIRGARLYVDPDRDVTFWLFKLEIQLGPEQQHIGYRINGGAASGFWVPAEGQSMHIMFHSCNGFSVSVNPDEFSGPDPLWRDVLNAHQSRPFHVMIGGGDQIYNDKVMSRTQQFADWTVNRNPQYKHHAPFTNEMKEELESFYLENYASWFSQGLYSMANAQIPMVNMWDDHDIIDGFGSYPHPFQLSPVFSGVGNVAFKYYMLFQQHSVEAMTMADEPSWVLGYKPGPYIKQLSRSIFVDLGRPIAFLALDCRTERMKNQVLSLDTCDVALERCRKEIVEGQTKHLIVLLGVPIAYPRMNWLENVLTSRVMDPVKALSRYGLLKGGFLNKFDGGVEILDDLDDHWTARHHKEERNELIKELQDLAAERSVRVTILGGDVHLAAIGQFYSNPKLKIPKDRDHRYMPNIVSSAIVNTPPPEMLADALNKRDKVHHLDSYTQESMIPMFSHDVNMKKRNNKTLLPRRNWCSITEYVPGRTPPSSRSTSPSRSDSMPDEEEHEPQPQPKRRFSLSRDDMNPRMLMRRLSSRRAPPTAYREGDDLPSEYSQRGASYDEVGTDRPQPRSRNEKLGPPRRTASETREPISNGANNFNDGFDPRKPPPLKPGFHRRPTNMSEKAIKKGNVPAVDAEGNEFDVNDQVSLEGGLDIVLNCEIDRNDPSGATVPYRLLIPALWYDGSSDREKLDGAGPMQRRPTLMNKLGFASQRGQKAAQNQGSGNWGQNMSETESFNSEEETENQPKKKFGLFGSRKKQRPEYDDDRGMPEDRATVADVNPAGYGDGNSIPHTAQASTTPKPTPPRMSHQAEPGDYNMPYDKSDVPQQSSKAAFDRPLGQKDDYFGQASPQSSSSKPNVLRKNSLKRKPVADAGPAPMPAPASTPRYQSEAEPPSATANHYQPTRAAPPTTEQMSPTTANRKSFTIGSARSSGSQHENPRAAYGADPTYMGTQQSGSRIASNPVSSSTTAGPPSSYPNYASETPRGSSYRNNSANRNTLSKPEQVLGIGTERDTFAGNPQQRSLRGNGILGRLGMGSRSSSVDRSHTNNQQRQHEDESVYSPQNEFPPQQRTKRSDGLFRRFSRGKRSTSADRVNREPQPTPHGPQYENQEEHAGEDEFRPQQKSGRSNSFLGRFSRGRRSASEDRVDTDTQQSQYDTQQVPNSQDEFRPQQKSGRSNSFLGRFSRARRSASEDRVNRETQPTPHGPQYGNQEEHAGQDESGEPQRPVSQGYSGIEAYREKPSLMERAKGLFEGKKRHDDDDQYSDYSQDEYSDDLGEEDGGGRHDDDRRYSDEEGSYLEGENDERRSESPEPKRGPMLTRGISDKFISLGRKKGDKKEKEKEKDGKYY